MSRTYRLRHEPTKVARHFSDGHFTLHTSSIDVVTMNAIVHGIFGAPCVHNTGQDLIEFKAPNYKHVPMDLIVNDHRTCYTSYFKWKKFNSHIQILEDALSRLAGAPRYAVAPPGWHEYAQPGRRKWYGRHGPLINMHKAGRKKINMKLRKIFVSGDDEYL